MEHGHAHPLFDPLPSSLGKDDIDRQQTPNRIRSLLGVPSTSSSLRRSPETPFDTPLSLPQRRLQLRNTGFRATQLPSHGLSTRISQWFTDKDSVRTQRQQNSARKQENNPSTARQRKTQGNQIPSSIFQEITTSTQSRHSDRSASIAIYDDGQDSLTRSWYHDTPSAQQSPVVVDNAHEHSSEMKLREVSGNAQLSPPLFSSPLARQIRGRSKRSLNLRKTSFPASEHIVFLEKRLEEVEKSQHSPTTGMSLKDKVKALTAENDRLQELLAELEHQFETRLQEAVEHKTVVEVNLRRKIKQLEEEIEAKDCTIRDLEYRNDASQHDPSNAEAWKAAVEKLESEKEGLKESNLTLERRNDVLTELLGQSPTRAHHGFELPSPVRETRKTTPRPKSMMPRIPQSPARSAASRPLSLHAAPSPFQHDYFSPLSALSRQSDDPCNFGENADAEKVCDDLRSIDSGIGDSCSVYSGNEPRSKRSSMQSYPSGSPGAWGPPFPPSPTHNSAERANRKRKTRRFISGSTQLKPLVLPTLNTTSGVPQSAPLPDARSSPGRREFPEQSMDPTISFLSQVYDTPTQPRQRSKTWAAEDAHKALEGASDGIPVDLDQSLAGKSISRVTPERALTLSGLPTYVNHEIGLDNFSPSHIDDVIMEEDNTALLSNQVREAGGHSFSSMAAVLSVNDSGFGRAFTDDQTINIQFSESELPRPLGFHLPPSSESQQAHANLADGDTPQTRISRERARSKGVITSDTQVPAKLPNPLASTYSQSDAPLQPEEALDPASTQEQGLCEHTVPSDSSTWLVEWDARSVQAKGNSAGIGFRTAVSMMLDPLKATPACSGRKRHKRPQSPLDLLRHKGSPTMAVNSVTRCTIFGTISRYTSYIREMRRSPTALARRVIANAWCGKWRRYGKLSWWVLGLFVGPEWKPKADRRQGWEAYDGEGIAQTQQERIHGPGPGLLEQSTHPSTSCVERQSQSAITQQRIAFQNARSASSPSWSGSHHVQGRSCRGSERPSKASWGRSLYLWGKFSIAIMLAVGGAIVQGPGEMLKDCDLHSRAGTLTGSEPGDSSPDSCEREHGTLYDYSLEPLDHEIEESEPPVPFQGGKSASRLAPRTRSMASVPDIAEDGHYTPRAPALDEYDYNDDNGRSRPSRSDCHVLAEQTQQLAISSGTSSGNSSLRHRMSDLGTLQWMQNLGVEDFARFQNIGEDGDRMGTSRSSSRKLGKRTHSMLDRV